MLLKLWKSEQSYPHAVCNFVDNCNNKYLTVDKYVGMSDKAFE